MGCSPWLRITLLVHGPGNNLELVERKNKLNRGGKPRVFKGYNKEEKMMSFVEFCSRNVDRIFNIYILGETIDNAFRTSS